MAAVIDDDVEPAIARNQRVQKSLIGLIANVLTRTAERRILAWHPAMRAEMPA